MNPYVNWHTPLKRACLPIPAHSQSTFILYMIKIKMSIEKINFYFLTFIGHISTKSLIFINVAKWKKYIFCLRHKYAILTKLCPVRIFDAYLLNTSWNFQNYLVEYNQQRSKNKDSYEQKVRLECGEIFRAFSHKINVSIFKHDFGEYKVKKQAVLRFVIFQCRSFKDLFRICTLRFM